jgi:glycosyltransferase involved in cell wall biosynthesis
MTNVGFRNTRHPLGARRQMDYLCLQPTREGQASYAHVNEIVAGMRRRGWKVRLIEPSQPRLDRFDGIRRAGAVAVAQLRYWADCRFRPARVVYIRHHFAAWPTAALARAGGSTVVQEVNGGVRDAYDLWPALRRVSWLLALSGRTQLRWADAIITVTDGLAEYVESLTGRGDKCHVVGNGADVELFKPSTKGADSAGRPYVVFVGALASWQGIDVLLQAVASPEWPAKIDLVIVGDGRERERVVSASRSNGKVRWLGILPYREVGTIVSGSLAALVPRTNPGGTMPAPSPVKLYEAMACGVPVIASDIPGVGDVVQAHDCGVVFEAGNGEALARLVRELDADPERAQEMGARGRMAAVERYSWDARASQTEQVILMTLDEKAKRTRAGRVQSA